MEGFAAALNAMIEEDREALTREMMALDVLDGSVGGEAGGAKMKPEELAQMVRGFLSLIQAGLAGDDSMVRSMYFDTVWPGLRDAGTTLTVAIEGSAKVILRLTGTLVLRSPAHHRDAALHWLSGYLGKYLGDIARVYEAAP